MTEAERNAAIKALEAALNEAEPVVYRDLVSGVAVPEAIICNLIAALRKGKG